MNQDGTESSNTVVLPVYDADECECYLCIMEGPVKPPTRAYETTGGEDCEGSMMLRKDPRTHLFHRLICYLFGHDKIFPVPNKEMFFCCRCGGSSMSRPNQTSVRV